MDAAETGGYRQRVSRVSPTNAGKWPRRRASSNVDKAGLKGAAWAKAMRLAGRHCRWQRWHGRVQVVGCRAPTIWKWGYVNLVR